MFRAAYLRKKFPVQHWMQGCVETRRCLCVAKRKVSCLCLAMKPCRSAWSAVTALCKNSGLFLDCLALANATGRLPETLVSDYQHTLRNNLEERTHSRRTEWAEFFRLTHVLVSVCLSNSVVKTNTVILSMHLKQAHYCQHCSSDKYVGSGMLFTLCQMLLNNFVLKVNCS